MSIIEKGPSPTQDFFAFVPVGIMRMDASERIVAVNPALLTTLGFSCVEQVVGREFSAFFATPADLSRWKEAAQSSDAIHDFAFECLGEDGGSTWMSLEGRKVWNEDETFSLDICLQSIDERKRAEQALEFAREMTVTANRLKSLFFRKINHDLRTPLNSILGFSQFLAQDSQLTGDQQACLDAIHRSGRTLLARIDELFEFVSAESGRLELHETPFDLLEMVGELARFYQNRAVSKGLEFACAYSGGGKLGTVIGDENRLRRVLVHLLDNAIRYTINGGVTMRVQWLVSTVALPKDTCQVQFEIEDSGVGIEPVNLEKIFEPFSQLRQAFGVKQGNGLGLAITRQFVQSMGGQVVARSEPGKGSVFLVDIPLRLAEVEQLGGYGEAEGFQENETSAPGADTGQTDVLRLSQMALPEAWVERMQHSLLLGDIFQVLSLIEMIRLQEPELAAKLAALAQAFDYEAIRAVVSGYK